MGHGEFQVSLVYTTEFQVGQNYIVRLCLKIDKCIFNNY